MGSESSADPPLCGEKPPELQLQATGYRSRHEKFTADINKSESKARHMIPAAAFLVAAGRKAHSLSWCSQLFRLYRMKEKEVVKNRGGGRSDS